MMLAGPLSAGARFQLFFVEVLWRCQGFLSLFLCFLDPDFCMSPILSFVMSGGIISSGTTSFVLHLDDIIDFLEAI